MIYEKMIVGFVLVSAGVLLALFVLAALTAIMDAINERDR